MSAACDASAESSTRAASNWRLRVPSSGRTSRQLETGMPGATPDCRVVNTNPQVGGTAPRRVSTASALHASSITNRTILLPIAR